MTSQEWKNTISQDTKYTFLFTFTFGKLVQTSARWTGGQKTDLEVTVTMHQSHFGLKMTFRVRPGQKLLKWALFYQVCLEHHWKSHISRYNWPFTSCLCYTFCPGDIRDMSPPLLFLLYSNLSTSQLKALTFNNTFVNNERWSKVGWRCIPQCRRVRVLVGCQRYQGSRRSVTDSLNSLLNIPCYQWQASGGVGACNGHRCASQRNSPPQ